MDVGRGDCFLYTISVCFACHAALLKILAGAVLWGIVVLFIYLKTPYFINKSFEFIYTLRAQEIPNVRFAFLWLGYSYVAFRLIYAIRDYQFGAACFIYFKVNM